MSEPLLLEKVLLKVARFSSGLLTISLFQDIQMEPMPPKIVIDSAPSIDQSSLEYLVSGTLTSPPSAQEPSPLRRQSVCSDVTDEETDECQLLIKNSNGNT